MGNETQESRGTPPRALAAVIAYFVLCVIGGVIGIELTDVYVQSHSNPDFQSFCSVSEGFNCQTVALSDYATFLGIPTSVWSEAAYLFLALLSLLVLVRSRGSFGPGLLLAGGLVMSLVSLWLIYVMAVLIHSVCILCAALDVVNFALLLMAVVAIRQSGDRIATALADDARTLLRSPLTLALLATLFAGTMGGAVLYGRTLNRTAREAPVTPPLPDETPANAGQWAAAVQPSGNGQCTEPGRKEPPTTAMGIDAQGHPWVGGKDPKLKILEYTDYECPHCSRAHLMLRKLLSKYPEEIRVSHHHFPLDRTCNPSLRSQLHPRACELSRVAVCAGRQGRFWEMNDYLFQHQAEIRSSRMSAHEIAKQLELDLDQFRCCFEDAGTADTVRADVQEGIALGIHGTPAFVINGQVYYGTVPDQALQGL